MITTARRTGNGRTKGKLKEGEKFSHLLLNSGSRVGQEAGDAGRRRQKKGKEGLSADQKERQNQAKLRTDRLQLR